MIPTGTNGFGSWDSTTGSTDTNDDDGGGSSDAYQDFVDEFGDTDTVYDTTPEDRPDEDPQDDPGNATDDGESVNVTDPEVTDPVPTYDTGDSSSDSDGGGSSAPGDVVNGGSGGTNTGTTDDSQQTDQATQDRLDQLLSEMEASSESAAVVPLPVEGSAGLTGKGAAAALAGVGALYLAFAGGS